MPAYVFYAAAIAATMAIINPAFADGKADAQRIWDTFGKSCSAIIGADDPVLHTATKIGESGAAGGTADERISAATVVFENPPSTVRTMTLQVTMNRFEGGRTVQCMLQLVQPDVALAHLSEIARQTASATFPDLTVIAGGPLQPIALPDGLPRDAGFQGVVFLRFATEEFPPSAFLTVQVMPFMIILSYTVSQAVGD